MHSSRHLALALLAGVFLVSATGGCSMLRLKLRRDTAETAPAKPRKVNALAADTDTLFHERWMAQRLAELATAGLTPDAAKAQANAEYAERYSFTRPAAAAAK